MKKLILTAIPALFCYFLTSAQKTDFNGFKLTLNDTTTIEPGKYIKLNLGTGSNGDYSYIYRGKKQLNKKFYGRKIKILRVVQAGSKKHGYRYIAQVEVNSNIDYHILLVPALETREIELVN